ncbi:MAG: RNA polymerase sigma factor [Bacteroidota bacterium]
MEKVIEQAERKLIDACLAGDRKAQFRLYARYATTLLNSAHRIVHNPEDAKDVLQESFLKAFQNLRNYQHKSPLEAWLRRIVINTAINHAKKKRLLTTHDLDKVLPFQTTEAQAAPSLTEEYSIETAHEALMELPNGYRTVVSLYLLEGYDHQEIADILGISVSTSLTQYARGKRKLASIIKKKQQHG